MTSQLGVGFDFGPDGSLVVVALLDEGRVAKAGDFKVGDLWIRVAIGDAPAELARSVIEEARSLDVAALTIEMLRDGKPLTLKIPAPNSTSKVAQLVADEDRERTLLAEFRNYFAAAAAPAVAAADDARELSQDQEAAELLADAEPPPRRETADDANTPFGPRPWPNNMPADDQRFHEASGQTISYSAQDPNYNPFRLPDGPPPASYWDH